MVNTIISATLDMMNFSVFYVCHFTIDLTQRYKTTFFCILGERIRYDVTFALRYDPSVCRLSVCLLRPVYSDTTQLNWTSS